MECVSYIRVSTQRQGSSGLGLSAQRSAVQQFCKQHGSTMVREFREVESGRNNDRAVLHEAIAYAKRAKATLLIAKLDRLARNVAFIANLMESGIEFRACDVPEANRLLLHIMAAVAEAEAKAISDRTRVALQAAKERGRRLERQTRVRATLRRLPCERVASEALRLRRSARAIFTRRSHPRLKRCASTACRWRQSRKH